MYKRSYSMSIPALSRGPQVSWCRAGALGLASWDQSKIPTRHMCTLCPVSEPHRWKEEEVTSLPVVLARTGGANLYKVLRKVWAVGGALGTDLSPTVHSPSHHEDDRAHGSPSAASALWGPKNAEPPSAPSQPKETKNQPRQNGNLQCSLSLRP